MTAVCGLLLVLWQNPGGAADASDAERYLGPKQVIAVLPFANRVQNVYGSYALGEGLSEILITELLRTNRFQLVERELLAEVLREQELAMTGLTNNASSPSVGRLSGAQYMIRGAVTEFNDQAGGGGVNISYSKAEAGTRSSRAYVGIDVRIVDNSTGQIYASYNAHAEANSRGLSLAAVINEFGDDFKFGASHFKSTPIGQATREAIAQVVSFIVSESRGIPWQGSLIRADRGRLFINRGSNANVRSGDTLFAFAAGEPLIDPETGFNLGSDEQLLCAIEVADVREKFSIALPGEGCAGRRLNRGDIVRYQQ